MSEKPCSGYDSSGTWIASFVQIGRLVENVFPSRLSGSDSHHDRNIF